MVITAAVRRKKHRLHKEHKRLGNEVKWQRKQRLRKARRHRRRMALIYKPDRSAPRDVQREEWIAKIKERNLRLPIEEIVAFGDFIMGYHRDALTRGEEE